MASNKKTIHTSEYHELIQKLISARKNAGFTQKNVADILGCSQSYISKIENAQIRIDPIQLKDFSKIYKIDLLKIFN
jgi:transcriptional regulator with XRE-family HTH domain